ncbi:MAG: hypothetical protein QUS33_02600 [Dehalococcoidia bacterium]|nr:hypothetical protein [Dehalococcoidia bacterium]
MAWRGNDDKIAEALKQAYPPAAASPEFKANLRLQLNQQAAALGSPTAKLLWQRPLFWIPAAAAAAVAAALIIFFTVFQALPPTVVTNDPTDVRSNTAVLSAKVGSLGADETLEVSFEWGVTTDYGNETTPELLKDAGLYEATLTGLSPNTTYHFRVKAVGSSGTTYGPDMVFTTGPGTCVVTTPATSVSTSSAILNGSLTSLDASGSAAVSFEWGTATGSYPYSTAPQTTSVTGPFSAVLADIDSGTTYYFRAKAVGDGDPVYGSEVSFTTLTPPSVTTNDATNVATSSATLRAELTSLGTAASVTVSFEWGAASGLYAHTTADQQLAATGTFTADLAGLSEGTTYYFRARAVGDGAPVYGAEQSFTTLTPPKVTTNDATNITATSATLCGELTSLGTAAAATVSFEWWAGDGSYAGTTGSQLMADVGAFCADLGGLHPGTTYYFRAVAAGDGAPVRGPQKTFTTLSTPPSVRTTSATAVHCTSAILNGILDSLGTAEGVDVSFEWGLTTAYGQESAVHTRTATGEFSSPVTGLLPGTTYHFRARAVGDGVVYGADMMFTTGHAPPQQKIWYLSADDPGCPKIMYEGDATKNEAVLTVRAGSYLEWRADGSSGELMYPAGDWLVQLTLSDFEKSHTDKIEIGTWDGRVFAPHGAVTIRGLGDDVYIVSARIPVDSFVVPSGGYVAVRVTLTSSPQTLDIHVGGANSFVQSPLYADPTAPIAKTRAASSLEPTTAVLNGCLDSLGSADSVSVYFEWGLTTAYGNETAVGSLTSEGDFSLHLAGLTPGTTYHFRVKVVGDGTNYGVDMTFTTPS